MNDLAEKALHGLDVARRHVAARPAPYLAALGFVVSAAVVVTGARIGAAPAAVPINRWLGLLPAASYQVTGVGMGLAMFVAIGALIVAWLLTLWAAHVRMFTTRTVWTISAVWAAPFVFGPPLLTTDIYRAVAAGVLQRRGHSPYHRSATGLGGTRLVDAIDPSFRSARSTDGPLATLVSHLAVSVAGGSVFTAMLVMRVVAVLSAVLIGRFAADLAGTRRAAALCLTVLNPAVLLYVVSAGQFTGPLVALLLAGLLAARQRRWWRAVILMCLAAGLKPVALLVVPAVVAAHAPGYPVKLRLRVALRDAAVALATLLALAFVVPYGLGWAENLRAATHTHTVFAPASVLGNLISFVVPSASYDDLAAGGRIAAAVAAVIVLAYLYATMRTRPLDRTVGYVLLAAGMLAPVLYPAYLLWGVLCLAPTAEGARRDWVVALSSVACVLAPVGLGTRGGQYATCVALGVIALALVPRLVVRHRREVLMGAGVAG